MGCATATKLSPVVPGSAGCLYSTARANGSAGKRSASFRCRRPGLMRKPVLWQCREKGTGLLPNVVRRRLSYPKYGSNCSCLAPLPGGNCRYVPVLQVPKRGASAVLFHIMYIQMERGAGKSGKGSGTAPGLQQSNPTTCCSFTICQP